MAEPSHVPPQHPQPRQEVWSFKIATLWGIPIRLHITFIVLLVWLGFSRDSNGGDAPLFRVLFMVALFLCVLLHELGHALVARRYGIQTRDILLTPIGGIANLEEMPPLKIEWKVALAGPVVNLVIALLLYGGSRVAYTPLDFSKMRLPISLPDFMRDLLVANIVLAVFNLMPVFPMDGGRVLRSLLSFVTSDVVATRIATLIGQFAALIFGLFAFMNGHWMLVVLAVFVYMAGGQEANASQTRAIVQGHLVREAMITEYHTLSVGSTLREAANALLAGSQQDFPVVNGEEVVGVLSRSALLRGWATEEPNTYIAGIMDREFLSVPPTMELQEVLIKIQEKPHAPVMVMEAQGNQLPVLVGMLTQENMLEFLMLTQLQTSRSAHTTKQ